MFTSYNLMTNIFPKIVEYRFLMTTGEGRPCRFNKQFMSKNTKSFLVKQHQKQCNVDVIVKSLCSKIYKVGGPSE